MADFTTGDGVRIRYVAEGREDGAPLILSNSLGADLSMWDGFAAEAAGAGLRVIRYDQRGHGGSQAPPGPYTLERLALDVVDLQAALGLDRSAFCGLSMGGMTGIWLARRQPRRFSRLALCNTAVWMPPRPFWDERIRAVTEGGMAAIVDAVVERWFTHAFIAANPEAVGRVRAMILANDPVGYAGCSAAIRDMDERDMLGLVEASTLVVIGAHDVPTPPDRGRYIAERIPGAVTATLDCGHLSPIEQPEAFNRTVLRFLLGERG